LKDALSEIELMRAFAELRLSESLPDETTIPNIRHFLEKANLGKKIFDTINKHLSEQGLVLRETSIIATVIISAPSSTKKSTGPRDPEIH